MIAKIYRYTIDRSDRDTWEQITQKATAIYRRYGMARGEVLLRDEGDTCTITEINYYTSREEMEKVTARVDEDRDIQKLFQKFLTIVPRESITEETYEVVQ